ncbi:hypothetical protein KR222_000557 [Zaprionus bogoriensis]|nr:hypothetical protein KR222_000557 [Zaprionus bogoriensis]
MRKLITRKRFILAIVFSQIFELIFLALYDSQYQFYRCYLESEPLDTDATIVGLEDVLVAAVQPRINRTIFFHETNCHSIEPPYILNLTARQACSIESAALNNPNLQVFVLFASPTFLPKKIDENHSMTKALLTYSNVQFRQLNIWRYTENTTMEDFLKSSSLFESQFRTEHLSDLLRLLSLYRYGGIYLDMDVVVLRNLEYLPLNFVVAENSVLMGNAVIGVNYGGIGRKIIQSFLDDYKLNYNATDYIDNGPHLVSRMVRKICGTSTFKAMHCHGLQVHDPSAFFPIPSPEWIKYFEPEFLTETFARTKHAYLIHLWNWLSKKYPNQLGSRSAYDVLAEENCPKTYAAIISNYF